MDVSERLSVEEISATTVIAAEHIHRYQLAAEMLTGSRVLDLGCGVGYGSVIIAGAGNKVIAVDNDERALADARAAAPQNAEIEFVLGDATDYLRHGAIDAFDAIVAFEVLEHVERVQETADALRGLVDDGVKLIASVPNSAYFDEQNEFHLTDFDRAKAVEYFDSIGEHVLLEQHLAEGSFIGPNDREPDGARLSLRGNAEAIAAHHYIALFNCGDQAHIEDARTSMQMMVSPQHARYIRDLERSNRELWNNNARLARAVFEQQGQTGGVYGSGAASRLRKFENRAIEAEQRAAEAEAESKAILNSPTWRLTHPLRSILRRFKKSEETE